MATNDSVSRASRHKGSGIADDASTRLRFHFRMLSSRLIGADSNALPRSIRWRRRHGFAIELGIGVEDHALSADQQTVRLCLRKRLDIAQLAGDGGALLAGIVERRPDRVQFLLGLGQQFAEFS